MTTHDLRNKQWSYVPQANPDGIVTVIRIENAGTIRAGDYVIVGGSWQARYLVLCSANGSLHCEQASRTMAEIDADTAAVAERHRAKPRQPKPVPIPKWVHPDFHLTYQVVAMRNGEESAAKAARAFKPASSPEALQEAM